MQFAAQHARHTIHEPWESQLSTTPERLLRLPTVIGMVGLGKTTIYDMMKNGSFPRPRRVRNLSLWVESEIQKWINDISSSSASTMQ
ncbi:AlpA family phage regulatory protein [Burkholderia sp. MS389]|uniref:helix-turn-helix transcriptional regulator n=1 Tax=Burkholderia sp. AU31280 TaxID=2015353 RepID=UPI000B7A7AE7|nr:transcriptional regulator [Burkholderia sp. AU31280]QRR13728.1 AlpA family phage regulatory protein [Burkholderia sp. MS389]